MRDGRARSPDGVRRAPVCFREHLAPGGVALVEPWFPQGVLDPAKRFTHTGEAQGVRVSRRSRTEIDGTLSRLLFEYEIEDQGAVRRVSEVHELGLFTTTEMMQAFRNAGLELFLTVAAPVISIWLAHLSTRLAKWWRNVHLLTTLALIIAPMVWFNPYTLFGSLAMFLPAQAFFVVGSIAIWFASPPKLPPRESPA